MSDNPTITVIVPVYNEEKLIRGCLDSLIQQNSLPEEFVLVDNNSTDRSPEILQAFKDDHPDLKIKLIHETRKGCAWAREAGWRVAAGEVIVHVDADMTFLPGWMKTIRGILAANPDLGAFGGVYVFENPPFLIGAMQWLFNEVYNPLVQAFKGFPYLIGGNLVIRREILEKMNGYADKPDNQLEDYYFSEQAHRLGYKLRYIPSLRVYHSLRRYEVGGMSAFLKWGAAGIDANQYDDHIR